MDNVKTDFNNGYRFLMLFVDIFSRWCDAVMLKSKNIGDSLNSLTIILDFNKIKPSVIMSDSESSFLSKPFQDFLEDRGIKHDVIVINNHRELSVVDRLCRTIREHLTKLFIGSGSTSWINDISNIIYQYNNSPHAGILGYTPMQVLIDKNVQEIILEYNNQELRSKSNINVSDTVRIFIKNRFSKGTDPSYSDKTYIVKNKVGKNIILDNRKRIIDDDLKIGDGQFVDNNLLENVETDNEDEKLNPIQEAHKEMKINRKIKQAGLERPTHDVLQEGRKPREKKIDFVKLSKGK